MKNLICVLLTLFFLTLSTNSVSAECSRLFDVLLLDPVDHVVKQITKEVGNAPLGWEKDENGSIFSWYVPEIKNYVKAYFTEGRLYMLSTIFVTTKEVAIEMVKETLEDLQKAGNPILVDSKEEGDRAYSIIECGEALYQVQVSKRYNKETKVTDYYFSCAYSIK